MKFLLNSFMGWIKKSIDDFANWWKPIGKSRGSGSGSGYGTYDAFNSQRNPTPVELIGAFTDTVFACSTLISTSLAEIPISLVHEIKNGKPAKKSGFKTKSVEIREVNDNPVLDLLYRPNPHTSYTDLIRGIESYLDIVGKAYVLKTKDEFQIPARLDLLPAERMTVEDDNGKVVRYVADDETEYKPEQIIEFRNFGFGGVAMSPAQSVWQKIQLSWAELSSWETIVKQIAQPCLMLSPSNNDLIAPGESEKIAKEFTARFFASGQGGVFVNGQGLKLDTLSKTPQDMAGLALQEMLRDSICAAYHVPQPLIFMRETNFASAKAAERSFQLFCLKPRIDAILDKLNHSLVREFDERLFLVADDFVEKDEQFELQQRQVMLAEYQAGIRTKNETRLALDLEKVPGGDTFVQPQQPQFQLPQLPQQQTKSVKKKFDPAVKYEKYDLEPVVKILNNWFLKQQKEVLGSVKSVGSLTIKSGQWVDLDKFTEDMANDLIPAIKTYYDEASKSLINKIGLTDDIWQVVQPKLKEAVDAACLEFCAATNATTSLKLNEARELLRQELTQGLNRGEVVNLLAERVREIFKNATVTQSYLIADTERTRAISASEVITAKSAGIKTKTWLADSMACSICSELNGTTVGIDEPFYVDPRGGAYAVVMHPPRHVSCRCVNTFNVND